MAKIQLSTKRLQLDKTNVAIVTIVSVACFITVFALVASKTLVSQLAYQNKVISQKEQAKKDLKASITGRDQLVSQYQAFISGSTNAIGGSVTGTGDRDGDNAKIVLDALPSKYDYPALAASLEKLMTNSGLTITSIAGTDDELNQAGVAGSDTPAPVDMPFSLSFTGTKDATQKFLATLQASIRPIQVQQITITGSDDKLSTTITAKTYYQPEKVFKVTKETVK